MTEGCSGITEGEELLSQLPSKSDQLNQTLGGFGSFVNTRPGLLLGVRREHPEDYRGVALQRQAHQPVADRPGDMIEMRGLATNHTSQRQNPVVASRSCYEFHSGRNLECSRYPDNIYISHTQFSKPNLGEMEHLFSDLSIKLADDDGDLEASPISVTFKRLTHRSG